MRRLIINADDFGLTVGVNRGIMEAHRYGTVTSSTLMACGAAFLGAVELAKSAPKLAVGCHIVLVDGRPSSPPDEVRTLVATPNQSQFQPSLSRFVLKAKTGRLAPTEIEREAAAQIRKLQAAGIQVSHIDTHKHTHMFPEVLRPLLRAAKACGISAVRNPFGPVYLRDLSSQPRLWKRWLQVKALGRLARRFKQVANAAGMFMPDGTVGVLATGTLNEETLRQIIREMPEGTWEFVCHPGYVDDQLHRVHTRLVASRAVELKALTAPQTLQVLQQEGVQLISYHEVT